MELAIVQIMGGLLGILQILKLSTPAPQIIGETQTRIIIRIYRRAGSAKKLHRQPAM